jgi:hypothetical protein
MSSDKWARVTSEFKGKSECNEYMCARIKFTQMYRHSDNQKTVHNENKVLTLLHD